MAPCFVKGADGFVDFFVTDGAAGFESVGGGKFVAGGLLGGEEVTEENMAVCEGFFDDEGVGGVVVEGVAEGRGFGGALGGVIVACRLDDLAKFAVGAG